jgi:thiol-disulfide isomerase/thioredoxin
MRDAVKFMSLITALLLVAAASAQPPAASVGRLRTASGDEYPGDLALSDQPQQVAWQTPWFLGPVRFATDSVAHIRFPRREPPTLAEGTAIVELLGGQRLYSQSLHLKNDLLQLNSVAFGELTIPRDQLVRLWRWQSDRPGATIGIGQLDQWKASSDKAWSLGPDGFECQTPAASIYRNFQLPQVCTVEFEVAWKKSSAFRLEFGAEPSQAHGYRLEIWDQQLVLFRDLPAKADVVDLGTRILAPRRLRLSARLDRDNERIEIRDTTGKTLASMDLSGMPLGPGIRFTNLRGGVALADVIVAYDDATTIAPDAAENGQTIYLDDKGQHLAGSLLTLDSDSDTLVMQSQADEETRVPLSSMRQLFFQRQVAAQDAGGVVCVLADGQRIQGQLLKVEEGHVTLQSAAAAKPFSIPLKDVSTLTMLSAEEVQSDEAASQPGKFMVIEDAASGARLARGTLSDGADLLATGGLVWQPLDALEPVVLDHRNRLRILTKDSPPPSTTASSPQKLHAAEPRAMLGGAGILDGVMSSMEGVSRQETKTRRELHLRGGDCLPAEITRIDAEGVVFSSRLTKHTRVPHSLMKAVELTRSESPQMLAQRRREQLLTLPRMQQTNPPTHVLIAHTGDCLRGRLLSMDNQHVQFELRLTPMEIPRRTISQIIWLHPDPKDSGVPEADAAATDNAEPSMSLVRWVQKGGVKLSVQPTSLVDGTLRGNHPLLGECQATLSELHALYLGAGMEQEDADSQFADWALTAARVPKAFSEEAGGNSPGVDSGLVGQEAPPLKLKRLDGSDFELAELKGQVVVLDFWASWCAPCMMAMPQLEAVCREFPDDVHLIGVNLQQDPAEIKRALDRLQISLDVVLDRDGVAAARYQASAIPQTVIIDRDGRIANLFVGATRNFSEQIRTALQNALAPTER